MSKVLNFPKLFQYNTVQVLASWVMPVENNPLSTLYTKTVTLKINVHSQPFLNQYQSDSSSLELIDLQSRNPFTDQSLHTVQSAASLCLLNLFLRGAGSLIDKQTFSLIKGLSETSTQLDSPVNHTIS